MVSIQHGQRSTTELESVHKPDTVTALITRGCSETNKSSSFQELANSSDSSKKLFINQRTSAGLLSTIFTMKRNRRILKYSTQSRFQRSEFNYNMYILSIYRLNKSIYSQKHDKMSHTPADADKVKCFRPVRLNLENKLFAKFQNIMLQ